MYDCVEVYSLLTLRYRDKGKISCLQCNKALPNVLNYKLHMQFYHDEACVKVFICRYCRHVYADRTNVEDHVKECHKLHKY